MSTSVYKLAGEPTDRGSLRHDKPRLPARRAEERGPGPGPGPASDGRVVSDNLAVRRRQWRRHRAGHSASVGNHSHLGGGKRRGRTAGAREGQGNRRVGGIRIRPVLPDILILSVGLVQARVGADAATPYPRAVSAARRSRISAPRAPPTSCPGSYGTHDFSASLSPAPATCAISGCDTPAAGPQKIKGISILVDRL